MEIRPVEKIHLPSLSVIPLQIKFPFNSNLCTLRNIMSVSCFKLMSVDIDGNPC